ncbi:MAG: Crp/Fnr family transcriptional regulator [Pseudomonadota bacterium]|nr:Crp/Fnr family transcriptional regulator [Pseudomonadota bacterium]MEC8376429.1 Crp/Fnr family transcriptional regulator [Pseudomonadota bacterium]
MIDTQSQQIQMPDALLEQCCHYGVVKEYAPEQMIHAKGDRKPGLSVVYNGSVSIGNFDINGNYQHRITLQRGYSFGEATLFNHVQRTHHAHAFSHCQVIQLSRPQFGRCAAEVPELTPFLLQSMSAKLNLALEQLDDIMRLPTDIRLAKILLNNMSSEGIVALKQQQLANLLGVTVLSCHSALKKLVKRGTIKTKYRQIVVLDRDALASLIQ